MHKIDMNKFPKIRQNDPDKGCIPVNIENILKYYGNNKFTEKKILELYSEKKIKALGFQIIARDFQEHIPNFEITFKSCQGSLDRLINYLKLNLKNDIPTILAIKANFNSDETHAVSFIGFNDDEFEYYDPGDGIIHRVNYSTDGFEKLVQSGEYHTLIIKKIV
jgi:hypothetical protein